MNTREVYLLTIAGWMNIRLTPGSLVVYDNRQQGVEIEFTATIGSKEVSYDTGFTPVPGDGFIPEIPVIPPTTGYCELSIGDQVWACLNFDSEYPNSYLIGADKFGGLYRGTDTMNPGFAPAGWHVPTQVEWEQLFNFVATSWMTAGKRLKSVGSTFWSVPNTGNDAYGFDARGGGFYNSIIPGLNERYESAYFWTSTPNTTHTQFAIQMVHGGDYAMVLSMPGVHKCSVRLIKDAPPPPITLSLTTTEAGVFWVELEGDGPIHIDWSDGAVTDDVLSPALGIVYYPHTIAGGLGGTVNITVTGMRYISSQGTNVTAVNIPAEAQQMYLMNFSNNPIANFTTYASWKVISGLVFQNCPLTNLIVHEEWLQINNVQADGAAIVNAADINNLLIASDLIASNWGFYATPSIVLNGGTNAAPTGAGIVAKNSLIAKGVAVTTN